MGYKEWMKEVDHIIASKTGGLTSDDLADGPSRDRYDSGYSPAEYADEILREEGFPEEGDY